MTFKSELPLQNILCSELTRFVQHMNKWWDGVFFFSYFSFSLFKIGKGFLPSSGRKGVEKEGRPSFFMMKRERGRLSFFERKREEKEDGRRKADGRRREKQEKDLQFFFLLEVEEVKGEKNPRHPSPSHFTFLVKRKKGGSAISFCERRSGCQKGRRDQPFLSTERREEWEISKLPRHLFSSSPKRKAQKKRRKRNKPTSFLS